MFFVILLNILYAIGFPMTKVALEIGQPLFMTALRMLIGGMALIGLQYFINPQLVQVPGKFAKKLFLSGLFNMYLTNFFELYGLEHMNSAKTAFIYNLSPFIAAFIGYLFLKEQMTPNKWLALFVAFIGSLFILGGETASEASVYHVGFLSLAELSVLAAATTTVYGCILTQQLIRSHYSSFMTNGVAMLIGGVMALAHSLVVENWNPIPSTDFWPFLGWIMVMIILYNFISYELYNRLVRVFTVTFLTLSGFTTPIFTAFFDWIWLGTRVGWQFFVASIFIFLGLIIFYKGELRDLERQIVTS